MTHTPTPWKATRSDPAEGADVWWLTACPTANQEKEIGSVCGGYPHEVHAANAAFIVRACNAHYRLVGALGRLLSAAKLLQASCEGCAVNHYGEDFQLHGLPGWLADTKADIETAIAASDEVSAS